MGSKIIAIGINKTGTKSLTMAMAELGYSSLHVNPYAFHDKIHKAIKEDKKILHYLEPYEFLSDIWLHTGLKHKRYKYEYFYLADYKIEVLNKIIKDYPEILFINNIRNYDNWVKSREKHIKNCIKKKIGYWQIFNRDDIKTEYVEQNKMIAYVKKNYKNKVIDFDIEKDSWNTLCNFFKKPIPEKLFPWKKKQRKEYQKAYIKK